MKHSLLALLLVVGPAAAQTATGGFVIAGRAKVVDGDTLRVEGSPKDIRLFGIDAPERAQICVEVDGQRTFCGGRAAEALAEILGWNPHVTCRLRDIDRYGRIVSICISGGVDIAAEIVRRGWAVDFPRYSGGAYEAPEEEAREAVRGVWAMKDFEMPWDWRERQRETPGRRNTQR